MAVPSKAKSIIAEVNKAFGANVLKPASSPEFIVTYLPTGLLPIDILLQGGLPRGRFTLIVGDYSTLKTYVGLCAIAETQKTGGTAALIDTEHAFDPDWARDCGVDVDELILYPPRDLDDPKKPPFTPGELALDAAEALTRQGVDLIVFDSIAATLPQAEQNKRLHDENVQPARLAALMSTAMRKLTTANSQTAFLWINQYRLNVGITFGNPQTITGGRAQMYYNSYILEMKKTGRITKDVKTFDGEKWRTVKEQIGQQYQATVTKSKLSKPFRDIFFTWNLEGGQVDMPLFLTAQGMDLNLVKVRGNTYTCGQGVKATGRKKFTTTLGHSPKTMRYLEKKIRDHYGLPQVAELPTPTHPPKKRVTKKVAPKKRRSLK